MGSQVLFYFFHWVEAHSGVGWVDKYVDSWINISGSMLGALKSLPALLSGEMKDTAQLNPFAVYGLEKFLGKDERCAIFRSMPGTSSLVSKFPSFSYLLDQSETTAIVYNVIWMSILRLLLPKMVANAPKFT